MSKKSSKNWKKKNELERDNKECEQLQNIINEFNARSFIDENDIKNTNFSKLPISKKTINGLKKPRNTLLIKSQNLNKKTIKFIKMTKVQYHTIPYALSGKDILCAAPTGSGKTLCFLIAILEKLWREKWKPGDGIGALILSPTRELALQIFQILTAIGHQHKFSACLITGGKKHITFEEEGKHLLDMNIIIATPGRWLQHLEQTEGLNMNNLSLLVLDEADHLLQMGFRNTLHSILSYLPNHNIKKKRKKKRYLLNNNNIKNKTQTMLFSATQTKKVRDLALLSLTNPEYISVYDQDIIKTPDNLIQYYVVCPLELKLSFLYSFIRSHLHDKIIVFVSTTSQCRFIHELFRRMQPGIPLSALHGKLNQMKRTAIYYQFLNSNFNDLKKKKNKNNNNIKKKNNNKKKETGKVLFATDVAARGLDFPGVDWVLQLDAPENKAAYIHRVGRTARYNQNGRSLLFLLPSEEKPFLKHLRTDLISKNNNNNNNNDNDNDNENNQINISKLHINPSKQVSISQKASALVAENQEIKHLAEKTFKSYLKSYILMPNSKIRDNENDNEKDDDTIFHFTKIIENGGKKRFAESLGLAIVPSLGFIKTMSTNRDEHRKEKNMNRSLLKLKGKIKKEKERKKLEREKWEALKGIKKDDNIKKENNDNDGEEDFFVVKQKHVWNEENDNNENIKSLDELMLDKEMRKKKKKN